MKGNELSTCSCLRYSSAFHSPDLGGSSPTPWFQALSDDSGLASHIREDRMSAILAARIQGDRELGLRSQLPRRALAGKESCRVEGPGGEWISSKSPGSNQFSGVHPSSRAAT